MPKNQSKHHGTYQKEGILKEKYLYLSTILAGIWDSRKFSGTHLSILNYKQAEKKDQVVFIDDLGSPKNKAWNDLVFHALVKKVFSNLKLVGIVLVWQ